MRVSRSVILWSDFYSTVSTHTLGEGDVYISLRPTYAAGTILFDALFVREISEEAHIFSRCVLEFILRGDLSIFEHEAASKHALRASRGQVCFLLRLQWRVKHLPIFIRILNGQTWAHRGTKHWVNMYVLACEVILKLTLDALKAIPNKHTTRFSERGAEVIL